MLSKKLQRSSSVKGHLLSKVHILKRQNGPEPLHSKWVHRSTNGCFILYCNAYACANIPARLSKLFVFTLYCTVKLHQISRHFCLVPHWFTYQPISILEFIFRLVVSTRTIIRVLQKFQDTNFFNLKFLSKNVQNRYSLSKYFQFYFLTTKIVLECILYYFIFYLFLSLVF